MNQFEDLESKFKYALEHSVIHRTRKSDLYTFGTTKLPYTFIAKSSINEGDTIIRSGEIATEKPQLFFGENLPRFSGFGDEYEGREDDMSYLFGRMFHFPSLNYQNQGGNLEVVEKEFDRVIDEQQEILDNNQNYRTAIISGPEDCWALSLVIYASEMTKRSAPGNLKDMVDRQKFNLDSGLF